MRSIIRKKLPSLLRDNRGITGLETAIVLIAFVVVSSVFAFAALSTGLFSSDQAKETIQAGLSNAQGTLDVQGEVLGNATITTFAAAQFGTGDAATTAFTLPTGHGPLIKGSQTITNGGTAQTEGTHYSIDYTVRPGVVTFVTAPANTAVLSGGYKYYSITSVVFNLTNAAGGKAVDVTPGTMILGYQDSANLDGGITNYGLTWQGTTDGDNFLESAELAEISVPVTSYVLPSGRTFRIQVKPAQGAVIVIERRVPGNISALMTFND